MKNANGVDSPATAKQDLSNFYGGWLEKAGVSVSRSDDGNVAGEIEISPLYADDAEVLAKKISKEMKVELPLYLTEEQV